MVGKERNLCPIKIVTFAETFLILNVTTIMGQW